MIRCALLGLFATALSACNSGKGGGVGIGETPDGGGAIAGEVVASEMSVSTETGVTINVEGGEKSDADFSAYLAPPFEADEIVTGEIDLTEFCFEFTGGWTYFTGMYPVGKTKGVKAVGTGTRFVMENGAGEAVRIYLIPELFSDCHVKIYSEATGGLLAELVDPTTFIEVTSAGSVGSIKNIEDLDIALGFIKQVKDAVEDNTDLSFGWWP